MFTIYHSNHPELFVKFMIDIMSHQHLSSPMQSEIILTENKTTAQWVEIQLTNYFGITANINFMNIKSFIEKMLLEILPNRFIMDNLYYDFVYWKFMEILPIVQFHKNCFIIHRYLMFDVNQQKCSQLSIQLTKLFLKYWVYRPDWLDIWKDNNIIPNLDLENQLWQSEVWRLFLKHSQFFLKELSSFNDYVFLLRKNIQIIHSSKIPNRVFIYGVTSLPPVYWIILDILSVRIDIYLWILNPFINIQKFFFDKIIEYSSDCKFSTSINLNNSSVDITCNINNNKNQEDCTLLEHTLLNTCRNIGQDTLLLLNQLKNSFKIKSVMASNRSNSMLFIVQKNILEFQNEIFKISGDSSYFINFKNRFKFVLKPEDTSISMHVCYSVQREIEVLHDNLLSILSENSSLLPGDIMVISPNMNEYIPAIKTVFNNTFNRKLPFSVASSYCSYHTHPIVLSILKIFNLSHSRFTVEEVLSLLSMPAVSLKFDVTLDDINLLHKWIIDSGIRWGLDEETNKDINLPIISQNTWCAGFKRILLGFSMKNRYGTWKNIFPYEHTNEDHTHMIAQLGAFLEILKKWRNRLKYSYTLKIWETYIEEIINDFFDFSHLNSEENKVLIFFKTCWIDILTSGIKSGYSKSVNISILQAQIEQKLQRKKINCKFIPNMINFCDISSISYIPQKVLCFIGMNYDAFPRNVFSSDFDLILKKLRQGDFSVLEQDCYIFLLLILLAKQKVYISFIEKMMNYNNVSSCQSIVVEALITYIACNFYLIKDKYLDITHNIECIRRYLLQYHSHVSWDDTNFIDKSKTQSFAKEWLNAATVNISYIDKDPICVNFKSPLPWINVTTILIQDLYDFYRHPVRAWFQKRLGVFFNNINENLTGTEPFFENNKDSFKLNLRLVDYLIQNKDTDRLYYENYVSGKLPYGSFGKLYWIEKYNHMRLLSEKIQKYYLSERYNLNIYLKFNEIKLIGALRFVQQNGLVRWKPSYISMRDYFLLWLEHLVYCSMGGTGDSHLFGINDICHFSYISKLKAQELLFNLISGYCRGINEPLILLYKSGGAWINQISACHNKIICSEEVCKRKAYQKLIQSWLGSNNTNVRNEMRFSESCDLYLRKILPLYLSKKDIRKIIKVSKCYFIDLVKYRVV